MQKRGKSPYAEDATNTKTILSKMSRWIRAVGDCGHHSNVTNDKQSRSSRGMKSIVGGDVAEGQKLMTPRHSVVITGAV